MPRNFALENSTDSEVNALVRNVITAQQGQIGMMKAWLLRDENQARWQAYFLALPQLQARALPARLFV